MGRVNVTVAVATFGDPRWRETAERVAIPSALDFGVPVVHVHGDSIHAARNACLAKVTTDHVIYLDADDELEPGYLAAMTASTADVRVPSVRHVTAGQPLPDPVLPRVAGHVHACVPDCLPFGNWIAIGALARTEMLRDIGGWRDYGWEDWDLWLRCYLTGAFIEAVPQAVYRAHVHPGSRGRYPPAEALAHHRAVAAANGVPIP